MPATYEWIPSAASNKVVCDVFTIQGRDGEAVRGVGCSEFIPADAVQTADEQDANIKEASAVKVDSCAPDEVGGVLAREGAGHVVIRDGGRKHVSGDELGEVIGGRGVGV